MFKLLIVDDEKLIREGLVNYIDWNSLEIEIIGTASNGQSALTQIFEKTPDIIISDISMPSMDGIEMLKTIREKNIKSEIIFISAYSNFEYAQNAIKYGAFDYILKPIEENVLTDIVKRCTNKLKEINNNVRIDNTKRIYQLFRELILGKTDLSKEEHAQLCNYDFNVNSYMYMLLASIVLEQFENQEHSNDQPDLYNLIHDLLTQKHPAFKFITLNISAYETVIVLLSNDSKELFRELSISVCSELLQTYSNTNNVSSISISDVHSTDIQLNRLYIEVALASLSNVYGFESSVNEFSFLKAKAAIKQSTDISKSKLLNFVKSSDKPSIQEFLNDMLLTYIKIETVFDTEVIKIEYSKVLDFVFDNLKEYPIKVEIDSTNSSLSFKKVIGKQSNIVQIYEIAKTVLFNLIDLNNEIPNSSNKKLISIALEFIHKNYNKDISLNDLANTLYITPSYLSKIFSEEVKEGFSKYLIKYRIGKAKELLRDTKYKVYEVAELVGYTDVCHFTKVFKENEGLPPAKYREL